METRYQRVGREQRERQASREARRKAEFKAEQARIRAVRKAERQAALAARAFDNIDHDYSMNG